jgi:hypothetical protein
MVEPIFDLIFCLPAIACKQNGCQMRVDIFKAAKIAF